MAVVADLHVHTTNSDGALSVAEAIAAAGELGLEAVAVTDHDRLHPDLTRPVTTRDGVTLIAGIELEVEATQRVDLLGYAVEPTAALEREIDRLQGDRIERGAAIIDAVEDRLGIDLELEARAGIGRPHIARAIAAHPGAPFDVQGAFDRLIGDGKPCYVPRSVPSFDRGLSLLETACSFVGLAHPLRYDDPTAALELTAELDAVERWYPYGRPVDLGPVDRAIASHDLLATGGSDAHDDDLGQTGLSASAYRPIRAALDPA